MKPVAPINTVELFPLLSGELIATLKALQPADWARPTVCAPWTVKDVAAHLLGGNFGRLWNQAEKSTSSAKPILGYGELLTLINRDNDLWVQAARRIGPAMLIELLELTDARLYKHFKSLPPDGLARITVAWAGDDLPPNWFDIAREYTEKWLHQQHIREAVGAPLLTGRTFLYPVLDTFLRGLPRTFCCVEASDGAGVTVQIVGEAGGEWSLVKAGARWQLFAGSDPQAVCRVQIDQDLAWRLFTKGVAPKDPRPQIRIDGDAILGEKVLETVSIMA